MSPPRAHLPSRLIVLGVCLAAALPSARGQGLDYVRQHYTKHEYKIPMRDGTHLFTAVYTPKDTSRKYPILLNRTPYSVAPYGEDKYRNDLGPWPKFGESGYIFALQDVRGRWMSEGDFVNMRPEGVPQNATTGVDESNDTYDTIAWLLDHIENHNGKVGMWGISYPGFYTAAALVDAHPALVAASPQAPINDWFIGDDWHHNGALMLPHIFNFLATFGRPRPGPTTVGPPPFHHGTPDGYQFFLDMGPLPNADARYFKGDIPYWNEVMQHGSYDDYWKARNLRPHLENIKPAVLTVGGWYDAENLFGALQTYKTIEKSTPGAHNAIVMGPWVHGGWARGDGERLGSVTFGASTSEYYRENIEFPFFEHHLKGNDDGFQSVEARMFETGANRWNQYDVWPPAEAKPIALYLNSKGAVTLEPPAETADNAFDEYTSDPAKPVPFIDEIDLGMQREYMVEDQRFAARRPDVLTYQTPVLDKDLRLVGPLKVTLHVATTGTDSDWVVKLVDVYPPDAPDPDPNPRNERMGGYQQLVRGDVMRGKFRKSFEKPEAFTPGEVAEVPFTMPDIHHTFRAGHRLEIQVQSSWFPLVDRNPQTFVDIYSAKPEDFQKATQRVYHTKAQPSRIEALVLP